MNTFTFDGTNKIIQVDATGSFEVAFLYSRWKDWVLADTNAKFLQAFRFVGGDPTVGGNSLGITYFLTNGWKIRPAPINHRLQVAGNLFTDDGDSPFLKASGSFNVLVESSVSNLIDSQVLISDETRVLEYNNTIIFDNINGGSGSLYPFGTRTNPINNWEQALQISEFYKIKNIEVLNDTSITGSVDVSNLEISGRTLNTTIELDFCLANNTKFTDCTLKGHIGLGSSNIIGEEIIMNELFNVNGIFKNCALSGSLYPKEGSNITFHDCYSYVPGLESPCINFISTSLDSSISFRGYSGGLKYKNITDPNFISTVEFVAGKFTSDPTNTNGFVSLRGVGTINDSGSLIIETGSLINNSIVKDISVTSSLDPVLVEKIDEIWTIHGLDNASPLYVDLIQRIAGDITQSIDYISGSEQTTVTRQ